MLMMETDAGVSSMIMYEDEAVDVRYINGTQLQLSPCGGEFLLVKAADSSGHPLQPRDRVRQRTRFTISTYKAMIEAALAFRNKHASRPYLPEELIPPEHRKPFFTINLDVQWPDWSSCEAEQGPGGETIIRSEEGRAALILSPSGEEFSVEFTCSLSQSAQSFNRDPDGRDSPQQDDKLICQTTNKETREVHQPGGIYQSTTVVQHHSCFRHAPIWSYPLSLACHHWMARLSTPNVVRAEGMGDSAQADQKMNMSDAVSEERRSHLPQALPLTCPSLHRHRWKFKDPLAKNEQSDQDFPLELVKVMWCQGVTYRILSGAVSVVEVSPGDGSVIRSNGVLNTYFTHHQPDLQSGQVKELSYHLNNLPPDICRQDYSICSIVSRASRILTCYNQTKQSLKIPVTLSCLQEAKEGQHVSHPVSQEYLSGSAPVAHHMRVESRSELVAAELEKIKRFNFLLENSQLQKCEKGLADLQDSSAKEETHRPVNEISITEALQRTSRAIQDIDALVSANTLT